MKENETIYALLKILLGVTIFTGTVPFTKMALVSFSPLQIGAYRVLIGGILSGLILLKKNQLSLLAEHKKELLLISSGMCLFPLLLALSLQGLPANFGGVALGLIPFATSIAAIIFLKEKVKKSFFFYSFFGSMSVILYSFSALQKITFHLPLIFIAIFIVAIGYTFGGNLAKKRGGVITVCLANFFILPLAIVATIYLGPFQIEESTLSSIWGLCYLSTFSQLFGFFPFYSGLAKIGIAKGVQVQLLQPFITLIFSYYLVGSSLNIMDLFICSIVVISVYFATKKKK